MAREFLVALTSDFFLPDGTPRYSNFDASPGIVYRPCRAQERDVDPADLAGAAGVIVLSPKVTPRSVSQAENLLAVGRFGVGYDSVDVPACTAADVLLFIAAGAVDRPVAEATVMWMLALSHHLRTKDRLVREGRWDQRSAYMGRELRDRTLGIIGLGGIGRKVIELVRGFSMNQPLAFDPWVQPAAAEAVGVRLVSLDELMQEADFVSLHCPLSEATRNLLGARELALMKHDAYFINTARGGIVDEEALFAALAERRIAGAALDCFVGEPLAAPPRFAELENVLLAPHCIAWTDEMFRDIGRTVCQGMIELAHGRRPRGAINPEVFERPGFQQKWARLRLG